MLRMPRRKCVHFVKICVVVILVVSLLTLYEQWRGGRRAARAAVMDSVDLEFERQVQEDEARIVPGLGEGGAAAVLTGEDKRLGEESEKKLAMNVYLSDRISYTRSLRDHRHPACARVKYDAELPSASVVVVFHNEPYSVVVRTLWSVVNSVRRDLPWHQHANFVDSRTGKTMTLGYRGQDPNSELVYLKEIILVDDNSTLPELKGKLSHYVRTRLPPDLIRILRLAERVGLTQARLAGARAARGDVLVFLDAHCEGVRDWLRPLLQRVKESPHAVVTPLIDMIQQDTLEYYSGGAGSFEIGGFTFTGHFTWIEIPEREQKRRGSDIAPTWSPTMAGGLFAINRLYYWELGAYDEQMAGWGGENLEMSFRIWQCGGTLETIPCSRVGHVFRGFHPYGLPPSSDTHGINTARMAEVWMDDFAELYYLHRPDLRNNPSIGDVTHRRVLREKLRCKPFSWYLQRVYPQKYVPVRDSYGFGRFRNPHTGMCLDSLQQEGDSVPLGLYPCHAALQATQHYSLSLSGELRDEERCAELAPRARARDPGRRAVLMRACPAQRAGQKWRHLPTGQLQHVSSGLCLDARPYAVSDNAAHVAPCDVTQTTQLWEIDFTERNSFKGPGLSQEQIDRLRRLRGQRRISRSLMSVPEEGGDLQKTDRRHSHKKKKHRRKSKRKHSKRKGGRTKNKFILKLVRTLRNNSEEHLEVDVHCRHRRLYPNNTFVRDLVTILNDRNIKVINNGRVFERNKVSDVAPRGGGVARVLDKLPVTDPPATPPPVRAPAQTPAPSAPRPPPSPPPAPPHTALTYPPYRAGGPGAAAAPTSKRWHKKHHHPPRPLQPSSLLPEPPPAPAPPRARLPDKKIIIEDFVEVKPVSSTRAPAQRASKHKRPRAPVPPPPARVSPPDSEERVLLDMLDRKRAISKHRNVPAESADKSPEDTTVSSSVEAAGEVDTRRTVLTADTHNTVDHDNTRGQYNARFQDNARDRDRARDESKARDREIARVQDNTGDQGNARDEGSVRVQDNYGDQDNINAGNVRDEGNARIQDNTIGDDVTGGRGTARDRDNTVDLAGGAGDARDRGNTAVEGVADLVSGGGGAQAGAGEGGGAQGRGEDWFVGESRFRSNASRRAPTPAHSSEMEVEDDRDQSGSVRSVPGGADGGKPVQITVKSNLTLRLGEEFFKRRGDDDDVTSLLGDLALPSNGLGTASPSTTTTGAPSPAEPSAEESDSSSDSTSAE